MGDAVNSVMRGFTDFGGNVLHGDLAGIGGDIGKLGQTALDLPGNAAKEFGGGLNQLERMFGIGPKEATGVTAGGTPTVNQAAGSLNGTTGAVGPAAASAGKSAAGIAAGDPMNINFAPQSVSVPQIGPGPAPVGDAFSASGASGLGSAADFTQQAAAGAANPLVDTPLINAPQLDVLQQGLSNMKGASPNAMQSLVHSLTSPEVRKLALPGALYGINAMNAAKPSSMEHMMKERLQNAEAQQTLQQRQLAAEQSGQLPQALQKKIDSAEAQAEAAIRQQYAAMGMSGSTQENAALAQARNDAAMQAFQQSQSMVDQTARLLGGYNTDVSNYLSGLYTLEAQRDANLRNAVVGFMQAAGYAPVQAVASAAGAS